ncbi:hypothetical protein JCM10207_005479 [Rhodosporidiobolus poonsookiae]
MKFFVTAAALAALVPTALAGLEDAQYSTVLDAKNFDGVIASQSEGTLVAFFAPWCGHCKNLEPTWTKIAQAFEGDDRCKVAHYNADEGANKPLAQKYGVTGYPTLKFIAPPSKGGQAEDYRGPRSEEAFLDFLNEKCGTHKLPGGLLSDLAGRIPSLDTLASLYLHPTATRPALLESASALASSLTDSSSALSSYYLKLFTKWRDLAAENVDEAKAWVEKERVRLGKIASKKGSVAVKQIEEARMKQNILAAFAEAQASASSLSSVASSTVSSAASAASASGSSLASAGSASASSLASDAQASASSLSSAAGAAATDAQASAASLANEAGASAESVYGAASKTVESATERVKETASRAAERVREEL